MTGSLFPRPRSEAAMEYARLAGLAGDLRQRVAVIERARDDAARAARDHSDQLAELERRRAAGEDVSADTVRKAERALTTGRARAAEPWAERLAGAHAALRAADGAAQAFAREHYEELAAELREEAEAAAAGVNAAMAGVLEARAVHVAVGTRASGLIRAAGAPEAYGTVPATRLEAVTREIDRVMRDQGGESVPAGPASIRPPQAEEAVA